MRYRRLCISFVFIISACTFSEPRLRPEPITTYSTPSGSAPLALGVPVPDPTTGATQISLAKTEGSSSTKIKLAQVQYDCAEYQSSWNVLTNLADFFSSSRSLNDNCIYVRARPSSIVMVYDSATEPDETFIPTLSAEQHDLIYHSDYNCNNFLARVFAARANASFGKSFFNTLISGVNTVITPATAIPSLIPTALSASNTVVSGTVADYVDAYVENQSLQDLEKAILAKRMLLRSEMKARICRTREWQIQHQNSKCAPILSTSEQGTTKKTGNLRTTIDSTECNLSCSLPADGNYAGYHPKRYWDMQEAVNDVMNYDRVCSLGRRTS